MLNVLNAYLSDKLVSEGLDSGLATGVDDSNPLMVVFSFTDLLAQFPLYLIRKGVTYYFNLYTNADGQWTAGYLHGNDVLAAFEDRQPILAMFELMKWVLQNNCLKNINLTDFR